MKKRKDELVALRASFLEIGAWKKAAEEQGVSLSEWIREWLNWAVDNKR